MTSRELAQIYERMNQPVPAEFAKPSAEYIRNTQRKVVNGISFRSGLEANAYQLLKVWERAGHISDLRLQPRFLLQARFLRHGVSIRGMHYTADFQFTRNFRTVVVEAKGYRTQAFELRRKLFLKKFPELEYEIWTRESLRTLV